MKKLLTLCLLAMLLPLAPASAQQMVFRFNNPAFGGNGLSYQSILTAAQLQNDFDDDAAIEEEDLLGDFESSLQRQLLSELSRALVANIGPIDVDQERTIDLGDFTVDVIPGLDGARLRVFNLLTGDETTVLVPTF